MCFTLTIHHKLRSRKGSVQFGFHSNRNINIPLRKWFSECSVSLENSPQWDTENILYPNDNNFSLVFLKTVYFPSWKLWNVPYTNFRLRKSKSKWDQMIPDAWYALIINQFILRYKLFSEATACFHTIYSDTSFRIFILLLS